MPTLNIFVKDSSGNAVAGARVACITKNASILPATRYTQSDGGCNLYFAGPAFDPPLEVDLVVDAAGFKPYCTADQPILFGASDINYQAILSFKRPQPAPRVWSGAFVIPAALPGQPEGYGDQARIWTPAYGTYPDAERPRILEQFVARYPGGMFVINSASEFTYHSDYPPLPDDPARLARDLSEIEAVGLVPVVCATDDTKGGVLTRAFIANGARIRIAFPMWEMNGPLPMPAYDPETDTFQGPMVDCIKATISAAPYADVYIHFTAGHGSIGLPERKGWEYCKRLGVVGLLSQDDGFWREGHALDADPEGTAAGLADTAMRLGTLGLLNVAFEQTTTPVYHKYQGWDEAHQQAYGAYLLAHAPGIAGFCDGGTV